MGERPLVVMLVLNEVLADGRVIKSAATLARAGWKVTVVGLVPGPTPDEFDLDRVHVVRLASGRGRAPGLARLLGFSSKAAYLAAHDRQSKAAAHHGERVARWRARGRRASSPLQRHVAAAVALGARTERFVSAQIFRLRRHIYREGGVDIAGAVRRLAGSGVPEDHFREYDGTFGPVLDSLQPQVIHAHDFPTLGIAEAAVARARIAGRWIHLVYDAHEYVRGLDVLGAERHQAALALEERCIRAADRIVTVSGSLAERLQSDYSLARTPTVVLNAPLSPPRPPADTETVRRRLGLPPNVPLLVYQGVVKPARGVHTLVEALAMLGEAHVVLVTNSTGPYLDQLRETAAALGAANRLHLTGYVPPENVATFVSDADVGVHPLTRYGNAEVALPNKLFEFMHARLPIVCSDTDTMGGFVRAHGVGEVFRPGDPAHLAAAVRKVLAEPQCYIAALTPELLARHSWEAQEPVLIGLYRELAAGRHVRSG